MLKIGLLAADFNKAIVNPMIEAVLQEAAKEGVEMSPVARVPGCYEVPLAAQTVLSAADCAGLVVVGYIEKGETLHGEVMGHVVHKALIDLSLQLRKPVGIGIIGPGATLAQAETRKVDYGRSALSACLAAIRLQSQLQR